MAVKVNQLNEDAADANERIRKLESVPQASINVEGDEALSNALAGFHMKID